MLFRSLEYTNADLPTPSPPPQLDFSSLHVDKMAPQHAPEGSAWRKTKVTTSHPGASTSTSSSPDDDAASEPASTAKGSTETVKYWYEVQRMFWHGKLGNLLLLPLGSAPAGSTAASTSTSDYRVKVSFYRACGADSLFPQFSGGVVAAAGAGAYARHNFSFEECKERHADLTSKLHSVLGLLESGYEEEQEEEEHVALPEAVMEDAVEEVEEAEVAPAMDTLVVVEEEMEVASSAVSDLSYASWAAAAAEAPETEGVEVVAVSSAPELVPESSSESTLGMQWGVEQRSQGEGEEGVAEAWVEAGESVQAEGGVMRQEGQEDREQ